MSDFSTSLSFAASGMEAQALRLRHVSENIANAYTPGYRRKTVGFQEAMDTGLVETTRVHLDQTPLESIYDPNNPLAGSTGHYD